MVIVGTKIGSSDNSGIRLINCIKILGPHKYKIGTVGDKIVVSIKKAISKSRVKKNEVHDALIIRTKKTFFRKLGTLIKFNSNVAVVIDKKKHVPFATRLYGPVLYEMRRKRFLKILAIAHTII
jgi:large subunit ribosomal protein L14